MWPQGMETVGSFRGSPIEDVISQVNMLSQISSVKGLACGCYRTLFLNWGLVKPKKLPWNSAFLDQVGLKHLVVLPPLSPKYWNY